MKGITVTLNPCWDLTCYTENVRLGQLNRVGSSQLSLGGKGVNVSRVLALLGDRTEALLFEGGPFGEAFAKGLEQAGICAKGVKTSVYQTRLNLKLIDSADSGCTEINQSGEAVTPAEEAAMLALAEEALQDADALFLGGSIPKGLDKGIYARLIQMANARGVRTALDCDGEALRLGLEARPFLIKPNDYELGLLVGRQVEGIDDAAALITRLHRDTGIWVLCTLGGQGSLLACPEGIYHASVPKLPLRGFTGAGDTHLAAFMHALHTKTPVEALRFASSASAAKITFPGTELPPDAAGFAAYEAAIEIRKIEPKGV